MNNKILHAVLDEDLAQLLSSIGKLENITNGNVLCRVCGVVITLENLQVIVPLAAREEFEFVCNASVCVESLSTLS